jgi:uncharacterized SAM-binding protein YcdF (DUF218 family)
VIQGDPFFSRRTSEVAIIEPPRDDTTPVGGIPLMQSAIPTRPPDEPDDLDGGDGVGGDEAIQRRWLRRFVRIALVLFGLAFIYYVVCFVQVWSRGNTDEARNVDAIVVLGAAQYDGRPSPLLAARLDHAADLYHAGDSAHVVVTGGKQVGDRFTEAEASAKYLVKKGVPTAAIIQVGVGHNTYESMVAVQSSLRTRQLNTVLIVTDPYHTLRSELIAKGLGLKTFVSPTRTSPVKGASLFSREITEAGGVAIGRIIGFHRLSDIVG